MRAPFTITLNRIKVFVMVPAFIIYIICILTSSCTSCISKHQMHMGMTFEEIQERWNILDGIETVELKLMDLDLMQKQPPAPYTKDIAATRSKLEISHMHNLEYIRSLKMIICQIIDQKYEVRGYENQHAPPRLRALERMLKMKKTEVWTQETLAPIIERLNMDYKTELYDLSEAIKVKPKLAIVASEFVGSEFAALAESTPQKTVIGKVYFDKWDSELVEKDLPVSFFG